MKSISEFSTAWPFKAFSSATVILAVVVYCLVTVAPATIFPAEVLIAL